VAQFRRVSFTAFFEQLWRRFAWPCLQMTNTASASVPAHKTYEADHHAGTLNFISQQISSLASSQPIPQSIVSRVTFTATDSHRLPWPIIWLITLTISVLVALTNCFMVAVNAELRNFKFTLMQDMFLSGGIGSGALVLTGLSVGFATVAALLVAFVAPVCAGSGLPEAKGYLNGNNIPNLFNLRIFVIRVLAIILAICAGFPIGREGPMVCIGGSIGYLVVTVLATPYVRHWVKINTNAEDDVPISPALLLDEERFLLARRIGCALGGAAGIAVAFNAPIGGILYMFEEVTVTSWPPELTFRAFVCTTVAVMLSRALLSLTGEAVHKLVLYEDQAQDMHAWHWQDVPFFFLLAAFVGVASAMLSRAFIFVFAKRRRVHALLSRYQPIPKILEVMLYAAVCAMCFALMPLLVPCEGSGVPGHMSEPSGASEHRLLSDAGGHGDFVYVRYLCKEEEHNEAATLLLSGAEASVRHLFSRYSTHLEPTSLALAAFVYGGLVIGMPGQSVPMGFFVPNMLLGAIIGRLVGEALQDLDYFGDLAVPGVYALVGCAAMLAGFTHMTIAIVVMLMEAAYDLSLIEPLMLGIFVSHIVATTINHHAYDEVLILQKGVPFLDAEPPHEMDKCTTAADLFKPVPEFAQLSSVSDVAKIKRALDQTVFQHFPVVSESRIMGLVTRTKLKAALAALEQDPTPHRLGLLHAKCGIMPEMEVYYDEHHEHNYADFMHHVKEHIKDMCAKHTETLPVYRLMDPSPFILFEDMPAPRFYPLFTKATAAVACVISKDGEFLGIITREDLISAASHALRPQSEREAGSQAGSMNTVASAGSTPRQLMTPPSCSLRSDHNCQVGQEWKDEACQCNLYEDLGLESQLSPSEADVPRLLGSKPAGAFKAHL